MNERWIGEARPSEHPDQPPETIDVATREEVEKRAREKRALDYVVEIYPGPSSG